MYDHDDQQRRFKPNGSSGPGGHDAARDAGTPFRPGFDGERLVLPLPPRFSPPDPAPSVIVGDVLDPAPQQHQPPGQGHPAVQPPPPRPGDAAARYADTSAPLTQHGQSDGQPWSGTHAGQQGMHGQPYHPGAAPAPHPAGSPYPPPSHDRTPSGPAAFVPLTDPVDRGAYAIPADHGTARQQPYGRHVEPAAAPPAVTQHGQPWLPPADRTSRAAPAREPRSAGMVDRSATAPAPNVARSAIAHSPIIADAGTSDAITQGTCLVLGLAYFVTGGVALARSIGTPGVVEVAGLGFTMIAAVITIAIGILLAFMGALSRPDRAVLTLLGVMMVGGGLVIAIEPDAFAGILGATTANGVLLTLTGATLALLARVRGDELPG